MAAVDQFQRGAGLNFPDQFLVPAVGRETAQLRRHAVNMAGPENGEIQTGGGLVEQQQFALPLFESVTLGAVDVVGEIGRVFRLREAAPGRIEDEVGGDEQQLPRTLTQKFEIKAHGRRFIADAVDHGVELGVGVIGGQELAHGRLVVAVGDPGLHSGGDRALAPGNDRDVESVFLALPGHGSADMAAAADDQHSAFLHACHHFL
ncbi:hypothetical protein SDC9_103253 [bioreactor metagenome]|uniref:Uncharacterized protein n=1 Tax=bioreactor metagenome TaxID=1076179 RepID=A0A645ATP6_9ZZZZ